MFHARERRQIDNRNMEQDLFDVVIIGAGPAGLTLAASFHSTSLRVLLLEKKSQRIQCGHADGLKFTTLEIFDQIGIKQSILAEAQQLQEICHWEPHPERNDEIVRTKVLPDVIPGLDKEREVVLGQGRIEHYLLKKIKQNPNVTVLWSTVPYELEVDVSKQHPSEYAAKISFRGTGSTTDSGNHEPTSDRTVYAKYVVGCDGARSFTREKLGVSLEGEQTDSIWGVVDFRPKTNFPDIRKVCTIHSASSGSILLVPRERQLVRLYVPLGDASASSATDLKGATQQGLEKMMAVAARMLKPYQLTYESCEWWSVYGVGQRVAKSYQGAGGRVFLAGDAVHTHSPKVGQGMNMAIQDAWNLGWKLQASLSWGANPSILDTYEHERLPVAVDLVDFDRGYLNLFQGKGEAISKANGFHNNFENAMAYTTGMFIEYDQSMLITKNSEDKSLQSVKFRAGVRMPDFVVLNQADATEYRLHSLLRSPPRFWLIVFPGDISLPEVRSRYDELGQRLKEKSFSESGKSLSDFLDVLTIHSGPREAIEISDLHDSFFPQDRHGYRNYERVFADQRSWKGVGGDVYSKYGISKDKGCMALVRPDGFISMVCKLEDIDNLYSFLGRIW